MKVSQVIEKLMEYNPDAEVYVITNNRSHEFTFTYGNIEGCTKEDCNTVSFYVDDTCQSESA